MLKRLIIIPFLCCAGCVYHDPNTPHYSWGFYSVQGDSLRDLRVEMGRGGAPFTVDIGVLGGLGTKHWNPGWRPMPVSGTVRWSDDDGNAHAQDVGIAANVPDSANFTGNVFFLFDHGRWRVAALSDAEQEARILKKDYRVTPD